MGWWGAWVCFGVLDEVGVVLILVVDAQCCVFRLGWGVNADFHKCVYGCEVY